MKPFRSILLAGLLALLFLPALVSAEQRFPPPEFESGYQLPSTTTPPPRALPLEYLDVALLALALALATWLAFRKRSRRGLFILSLLSLAYFGFYREGCICAIGSVQNVALALGAGSYTIPVTALAFFLLPIAVSLFAGRTFCAAVCPHGALQDLVLLKPVKIPPWLEKGLGVIPFVYLGAALLFAATGTTFIICRYDPFVPFFRFSGSFVMVTAGALLLLACLFVGRSYCRFLCPLGALFRISATFSKWRVRVTPDECTQCRLCEHSCPFGAMREPSTDPTIAQLAADRKRLGWLLLGLPLLILAGAATGFLLSGAASRVHPTVALSEQLLAHGDAPIPAGPQTPQTLALKRASQNRNTLLADAALIQRRFQIGTPLFGGFVGLVIGAQWIGLTLRKRRTDYEPDRGACFACARCFEYCPSERARRGWLPLAPEPGPAQPNPASPPST